MHYGKDESESGSILVKRARVFRLAPTMLSESFRLGIGRIIVMYSWHYRKRRLRYEEARDSSHNLRSETGNITAETSKLQLERKQKQCHSTVFSAGLGHIR